MLREQLSELSNHDIEERRITAQEESGIDYINQDDLTKAVRSMHNAIEYMDHVINLSSIYFRVLPLLDVTFPHLKHG